MTGITFRRQLASCLVFAFVVNLFSGIVGGDPAAAIGLMTPVPGPMRTRAIIKAKHAKQTRSVGRRTFSKRSVGKGRLSAKARRGQKKAPAVPRTPPQDLIGSMKSVTLAPGVVHKYYRGGILVNVIDVDMIKANVQVRPVLSNDSNRGLADVRKHAAKVSALAAVNANYFKKDGTPLGTLIMNGEWIAGPLFDRVSMGITRSGYVRVDRVNLYGILQTSNPSVPNIWVNNINQPRRTGARLIAYTRRWGQSVHMSYAGCLVAVNSAGEVVARSTTLMSIPPGGMVLSDKKGSAISRLSVGDTVRLVWRTRPQAWRDVVSAVSGGPMLIKDGKLFLDLKGEQFRSSWAGSGIKARTAAGVTWDNHLLLATIEGPHTLWDFAKFLQKLGAVDAMNLDGGGSTTMVVKGRTVTRNADAYQRRVASSLAVIIAPPVPRVASSPTDFAPKNTPADIDEAAIGLSGPDEVLPGNPKDSEGETVEKFGAVSSDPLGETVGAAEPSVESLPPEQ